MSQQFEHWFQYFPKSFMWSQGFMSAIEMIPYGERRNSLAAGPFAGATLEAPGPIETKDKRPRCMK